MNLPMKVKRIFTAIMAPIVTLDTAIAFVTAGLQV